MPEQTSSGGLTVEATLALVVERLGDLRVQQEKDTVALTNAIAELRQEMQENSRTYVPRAEWEQRNRLVDERHETRGKELNQLKIDQAADFSAYKTTVASELKTLRDNFDAAERSRRVPALSVGALVVSSAVLVIQLLNLPLGLG